MQFSLEKHNIMDVPYVVRLISFRQADTKSANPVADLAGGSGLEKELRRASWK
jgi:hypothetical protein